MKPIRSILLTAFLTILVFSTITYTACHKDKCNNVNCLNGGVCDAGNCECLLGYEGSRCGTLSRDKFVTTFNGHDLCNINDTNRLDQYSLLCVAIPSQPGAFEMRNFINNLDDSAACTMQSTDSFTFIGSNNGTTFSGYGTLRADTLRMAYKVQIDTVSYSCHYIGGSYW